MYQVILVTCPNKKEARKIATFLVKERLASCVNIIDRLESFFWWQKKIDYAKEVLLIIKSKKKNFSKVVKNIKRLHSYKVPEIIALKIIAGEKKYLNWIDESLGI